MTAHIILGERVVEIFPGILRIAESFKGILLDAYGVFWGGNACGMLPGTKEVMEKLVCMGKIVGILSNTTQLGFKEIMKLQAHGVTQGKHFHFFVTSGDIGREAFLHGKLPFDTPRRTFGLVGKASPKHPSHEPIFQGTTYRETVDMDEADFLYILVPHIHGEDQTDAEVFRKEIEGLRKKNLPMVCLNPDQYAYEGNPPRAVVRQGSLARMYEEMGGSVVYVGKPSPGGYRVAMRYFEKDMDISPTDVLMVGDTPATDIRGARLFGMPSALVLQTGMMAEPIARQGLEHVLSILSPNDLPDYCLERFADDL